MIPISMSMTDIDFGLIKNVVKIFRKTFYHNEHYLILPKDFGLCNFNILLIGKQYKFVNINC